MFGFGEEGSPHEDPFGFLKKTQICRHFARGNCTLGSRCRFAHGGAELKENPDLRNTRLCFSLGKREGCRRGSACPYAHSLQDLRNAYVNLATRYPEFKTLDQFPTDLRTAFRIEEQRRSNNNEFTPLPYANRDGKTSNNALHHLQSHSMRYEGESGRSTPVSCASSATTCHFLAGGSPETLDAAYFLTFKKVERELQSGLEAEMQKSRYGGGGGRGRGGGEDNDFGDGEADFDSLLHEIHDRELSIPPPTWKGRGDREGWGEQRRHTGPRQQVPVGVERTTGIGNRPQGPQGVERGVWGYPSEHPLARRPPSGGPGWRRPPVRGGPPAPPPGPAHNVMPPPGGWRRNEETETLRQSRERGRAF